MHRAESARSFVSEHCGTPAVTGSVTFCPTWLGAREVWPVSLIAAVEEATLIFRAAPLPQPAKVTLARMSQPHEPPHPVTLYFLFFSSATISSPPLRLCNHPISIPRLFSPSFDLAPVSLSRPSLADYISFLNFFFFFVRLGRENLVATGGKKKTDGESSADLDSRFTSYAPPGARGELQRAAEKAGVRSPGEHQRTSAEPETGPQRVQGMMGFFFFFPCSWSHCATATIPQSEVRKSFWTKLGDFIKERTQSVQQLSLNIAALYSQLPGFLAVINHAAQPGRCNQNQHAEKSSPPCLQLDSSQLRPPASHTG